MVFLNFAVVEKSIRTHFSLILLVFAIKSESVLDVFGFNTAVDCSTCQRKPGKDALKSEADP